MPIQPPRKNQCLFIEGDPLRGGEFCEADAICKSYCAAHYALTHQKSQKKNEEAA